MQRIEFSYIFENDTENGCVHLLSSCKEAINWPPIMPRNVSLSGDCSRNSILMLHLSQGKFIINVYICIYSGYESGRAQILPSTVQSVKVCVVD